MVRFSKPVYDQKYHPMDDVVQPSRAAQHRARYDQQYPSEDSEGTDFNAAEESDSDADADPSYPSKRRKFSEVPTLPAPGIRRSSRHVNREVLYNTSVHPQDEEIDHMEIDSSDGDTTSEAESGPTQSIEGDTTAVVGHAVHHTIGKHSLGPRSLSLTGISSCHLITADPVVDDEAFESSSPPLPSSPLSSITLGAKPSTNPRLAGDSLQGDLGPEHAYSLPTRGRSPAFHIYEDTLEDELARDARSPVPTVEYPHDDKENPAEDSDYEDEDDIQVYTTIRTNDEFDEEGLDAVHDAALDFSDRSIIDDHIDGTNFNHPSDTPGTIRETSGHEDNSLLGTLPPPQRFDRVVLGEHDPDYSPPHRGTRHRTPSGGYGPYR